MNFNKLLIVEDEALTGMVLKLEMQKAGFEIVAIVTNGKSAIEKTESGNPDCILMDIRIAGTIDGIETARLIKEKSDVPIIFMTGYAEPALKKRALETNPLDFLIKPVHASEIITLLNNYNNSKTT
ncbi:MAG TPA: response regulator [Ignavibacteriaceae bacterium]|nr:response regulator [Ignavibacteriaceae bacterium]